VIPANDKGSPIQERVLVVEDDAAVRGMLLVVLEAAEYAARGVANGIEALESIVEWRPDVIVLDLRMPVIDGYEFLSRRLADPDLASIPVVVVTAEAVTVRPIEPYGVQAVVRKPHDVEELRTLIAQAILDTKGRKEPG
jgi:CheY-like chemotaxis protein